jgi:tellurite resistance protein TehA-like permease
MERRRRLVDAISPASGAVVMGTGIASLGLSFDHRDLLSRILLAITAAVWIALGLVLIWRALSDRERVLREARMPSALTGVAGTAVLGSRLETLGWNWAGISLLVIALALWLMLLGPVLRGLVTPTVGVSLMLTVATESLAVLAVDLASHERAAWLLYAAFAPLGLGLALYAWVMSRFDLRQLVVARGDHWITGGALAISTLAAGEVALAARSLHELSGSAEALRTISTVLWATTVAWLPVLLTAELLRPRLVYDVRRWATVFPVGMYAACSFVVGAVAHIPGITDFAQVWVWVGLALWLSVFIGLLASARRVIAG